MKISLNWLRDYVETDLKAEQIAEILSDLGLPCEGIEHLADDAVIDVEVTSNRGDCLSHIGIARELAAATGKKLRLPDIRFEETERPASEFVQVEIREPDLCRRYTARVIEGRQDRTVAGLDGQAAGSRRHAERQQRRRCDELRDDGDGPAAARVRLCDPRRAQDHRAQGRTGRADRQHRRDPVRVDTGNAGHRRCPAAGGGGRHHGRSGHGSGRRDHHDSPGGCVLRPGLHPHDGAPARDCPRRPPSGSSGSSTSRRSTGRRGARRN